MVLTLPARRRLCRLPKVPGVTLVGCRAHARRKFDEALKALLAGASNTETTAQEGLAFCNELFAIERELKDASPEERHAVRLERSKPVVEALLGMASEAAVPDPAEKSTGTGDRVQSQPMGEADGFNGLNPFEYLKYLFEQLLQLEDPKDPEALARLLPWSFELPPICRASRS